MNDKILACDLHDYIEIACLYQIKVVLELQNGATLEGVAANTKVSKAKIEYLEFKDIINQKTVFVSLADLKLMTAIDENRHFKQINFN
jgi:Rho-binding antiterminator